MASGLEAHVVPAAGGGNDTMEYTRGKAGETDNKGLSLVQQHALRVKEVKRKVAAEKLTALTPTMSRLTRQIALEETGYNVDKALEFVRAFQQAHPDQLDELNKRRLRFLAERRSRKRAEAAEKAGAAAEADSDASPSAESSSDDSSGASDSDSSGRGRGSRRRDKRRSKSKKKSRKRSRRSRSRSRDRTRSRKRDRREKDKKAKRTRSSRDDSKRRTKRSRRSRSRSRDRGGDQFGKYGVLRAGDVDAKRPEFAVWAREVKGLDIDVLPGQEEKELWSQFVEDFNTATMPSKKYYDLAAYEQRKAARAGAGELALGAGAGTNVMEDEASRRRELVEARRAAREAEVQDAYRRLKESGRAGDMREQDRLRAEMTAAYRAGDTEKAYKIQRRLEPDERR
ncbi:unnamed protein product [Pedinophyceae sp. YPF-701]|nr:unnamed protein product [Pedinophyceae sp. YPF-701]